MDLKNRRYPKVEAIFHLLLKCVRKCCLSHSKLYQRPDEFIMLIFSFLCRNMVLNINAQINLKDIFHQI